MGHTPPPGSVPPPPPPPGQSGPVYHHTPYQPGMPPGQGGQQKSGCLPKGCLIALAIIGALALALIALAVIGVMFGDEETVAETELEEGMCLDEIHADDGLLELVDCGDEHLFEVSENIEVSGEDYPGRENLHDEAGYECSRIADDITAEYDVPQLQYWSLSPSEETWEAGDRTIVCFVGARGGRDLIGSHAEGTLEHR